MLEDLWTIDNPPAAVAWLLRRFTVASGPTSVTLELAINPDVDRISFPRMAKGEGDELLIETVVFRVDRQRHRLVLESQSASR